MSRPALPSTTRASMPPSEALTAPPRDRHPANEAGRPRQPPRQREQLEASDQRLKALDDEWNLLQGLRSGAVAEDLFVIIDAALPGDDVWFTRWSFARAGVIAPPNVKTVNSGYFIVVPAGQRPEAQPSWQVRTHMDINGEARNHAALSRFVRGLFAQPQIQDVKVNRTQVRDYVGTPVVDFSLAIVLHSEPAA